ncbi:MAG: Gldg family protein [Candidatus Acidiferrales bacterium]|jgi:ABC-type uncharacterized transport system involved in gliding motility auxiliary subunit
MSPADIKKTDMNENKNTTKKVAVQEIYRTVAWFGAALLAAGYVRYSIQGELLIMSKILLGLGAAMLIAGLALNYRVVVAFFSRRSAKMGTNVGVLGLAVFAILALINFVGYRHHKSFDWTTEKLFTLSDETQKIVQGLQQDVTIYRFDKMPNPELAAQIAQYSNVNHRVHYISVDPQEKPELAKQYGITRMGQMVAVAGEKNEKLEGTSEQDITNALLKLTRNKVETVCFVTGHGEKSISAQDGHGLSQANDELKKESYQTREVNLVTTGSVPADCTVLVDAGPTQSLFPPEAAMIAKYLDGGGRALLLIDPATDPKLDDVFQAWNINVGNNYVIDASGYGRLIGAGPAIPLVVDFPPSPITKGFQGSMTFFPLARTVSIANKSAAQPQDIELLKTSERSFTVPNLDKKEVTFDPKTAGPLSLGVSGEKHGEGEGGQKTARLVTIGDSDFATNQAVGAARNGDLFYNAINWLASDESLISIRPKNPANRRVNFTEGQQRGLFWVALVFLPGLVILSGIYMWIKRR